MFKRPNYFSMTFFLKAGNLVQFQLLFTEICNDDSQFNTLLYRDSIERSFLLHDIFTNGLDEEIQRECCTIFEKTFSTSKATLFGAFPSLLVIWKHVVPNAGE